MNFQTTFAMLVATGTKTQTIRAKRKDGRDPRPGDRLYLYTGMRTKGCRKLGEAVCSHAYSVTIHKGGIASGIGDSYRAGTWKADAFARLDGFSDFEDMRKWFAETHGLPFRGVLIGWPQLEKQHSHE